MLRGTAAVAPIAAACGDGTFTAEQQSRDSKSDEVRHHDKLLKGVTVRNDVT
jgi:hypothetical protein